MGGCAARPERVVRPQLVSIHTHNVPAIQDQINLESYYLFWLDRTVKSPEFIEVYGELRSHINHIKTFESPGECQDEFAKITNGRIFLIANCAQLILLLPHIHDHPQSHAIYTYNAAVDIDTERMSMQYKKIRGIYDSFLTAKRYFEDDIELQSEIDDPMVTDFWNDETSCDYREKFNLFLQTMNVTADGIHTKKDRQQLIEMCAEYYEGNEIESNLITEFRRSYTSKKALEWYLRRLCFYRLLSRALIEHDMNILVDMYSFIFDINQNLQKESVKQTTSLRVYRGLFLSNDRITQWKNSINQMITMQCFFRAQTSLEEILHLLQSLEPNDPTIQRVIFEIDVYQNYTLVDKVDSSTSKTILFPLGTVFKIIAVSETTITLSQCVRRSNENCDLVNESADIIRGVLTYLQHGTTEGIKYFEALLTKRGQTNLAVRSSACGQLGYLQQKSGDLGKATKMYEQVLENGKIQFDSYLFYLDQAAQYYGRTLGDWNTAKIIWRQKLNIQSAFLSVEEKAQTYENLAHAAMQLKQYDETIQCTLAAIESLPNDHSHLPFLQQQLESARKNQANEPPAD